MADGSGFPTADRLLALPADDWSQLLVVCLPVLRGLTGAESDATVRRLASVPLGRLVSGRSREDLARVLTRPGVWPKVAAAVGDGPRPWTVASEDVSEITALRDAATASDAAVARLTATAVALDEKLTASRARATAFRDARDAAQRAADGANARAAAAEGRALEVSQLAQAAAAEAAALRGALATTDQAQRRAVEREQRRAAGGESKLRDELTASRREVEELRAALADAQRRLATPAPTTPRGPMPPAAPVTGRGERGRPSRLPDGMVAGTTEAAGWLVSEGRVLLVDGYNVSRTNRPALSFADQRRWLEEAVSTLVQRRRVDATIVWDASLGSGRTANARRQVTVRYTTADMTADDEIVLHVRSMLDPATPCVVVTDDAELRSRLAPHRVDVLDTRSFTWLL